MGTSFGASRRQTLPQLIAIEAPIHPSFPFLSLSFALPLSILFLSNPPSSTLVEFHFTDFAVFLSAIYHFQ